ncbi:MAG: glycosyltransferase family 2 protein [Arenicellales bacterium]
MRLLIAIPCLNEVETIGQVIQLIPNTMNGISKIDTLVVDDGSDDGTSSEALKVGAQVFRHQKNLGFGRAFRSAIDYAVEKKYDMMVSMDGDGQFNPKEIESLVRPLIDDRVDFVTGSRFANNKNIPNMSRIKLIGNKLMSYFISKLVGESFQDVSCGFRSFNRRALLRLNLHGNFTCSQETFLECAAKGMKIVEIPIAVTYFADRESRIVKSIVRYMFNTSGIILSGYRDYFPLKFFWLIALICFVPGSLLGAMFLGHFFINGVFKGYLFAGFTSAFLLGLTVIFLVLGIVADMLGRIRSNQEQILYQLKQSRE